MLRSVAQVCVHHCPGLLRGLGSVLFDPMALFAQVLLYEDPPGDQHFALGVFKWRRLLEGGFPPGTGEAESCTKSWGPGACLWTSLTITATAAHRHSSPWENRFLTEVFGTGGGIQGCALMGSVPVEHSYQYLSFCP